MICASLDGRVWDLNEPHPTAPIHPRCRCFLLPKTDTYKNLGLDIDELKSNIRPYTERGDKRKIIEAGQFVGDFEGFLKSRDKKYQMDFLGPNRYKLWKSGKIKIKDLSDKNGVVKLLKKDKDGNYIGLIN